MKINELYRLLKDSDECSWMAVYDITGTKYLLKDDIRISVYLPDNIEDSDYYVRTNTNPEHPIGKKLMFEDDLIIHVAYICFNGVNIFETCIYFDKGYACYLPPQLKDFQGTDEYIVARWIKDLTEFMSNSSDSFFNKCESLNIKSDSYSMI